MTMPRTLNNTVSEHQLMALDAHPGHLLRRAQQISASLFHEEFAVITPVQYAILLTLNSHPGIDQISIAALTGVDTSTAATVCARLEEKGLLTRTVIPHNKRQRALHITADGIQLLTDLIPASDALRERILAPFSASEQQQFMTLLMKLVDVSNNLSRAPLSVQGKDTDKAA